MALTTAYSFTGNANWSLDATSGSLTDGGTIEALVPDGSTVEAAFLYASAFASGVDPSVNFRLDTAVRALEAADFTALGETTGFVLEAHRADVTEFVSAAIGDGQATPFEFTVDGMGGSVDGYSLTIVYSNPTEEIRTIAFLDGFSNQDGDDFRLAFNDPIDVADDVEALMSLGIGFGFQSGDPSSQFSIVDVNGDRLTSAAGGYDDGDSGNGGLITVGGIGDSTDNPVDPDDLPNGTQNVDDELYDLAQGGYLETGDSSIFVQTQNPSNDDNIFFAGFRLDGTARIATAGNDAPVGRNDVASTDRNTVIRIQDVTANDFDPDGDPISLTAINGAAAAVGVPINLASGAILTYRDDGTFDYDPNGIALDSDSFRYTISDGALDGAARVDIKLGDRPETALSISDGVVLEGDSGPVQLTFDVMRTGDISEELAVTVDITGITADSSDVSGTLPQVVVATLNPGDTSVTVSIDVEGDTIPEFDETMEARITSVVSTKPDPAIISVTDFTGILTILDDDREIPPEAPGIEADIWGDPHLTTLDGLGYDFQAVGEFVLVENTAGDNMSVQIRTEPINDAVSIISVMSAKIGDARIQITKDGDTPLTVNGVATTIDPLTGPLTVGDGKIYFNAEDNMYTIVQASGEQVIVGVYDGFLNVCVALNEDRPVGSVRGLLGNADSNSANDLSLRDGTVLAQPVSFDDLYGQYADSWRISEVEALFDRAAGETTADFTDSSYPRVVVTLDDLPAQLVADATAVVDAAGITDPILRENAILDFALTGDDSFVKSATALLADPDTSTDPSNTPTLGQTIGIRSAGDVTEGNDGDVAVQFEVYRIGDTTGTLNATVVLSGDTDSADFEVEFNPDDLTVEFADGETSKTIIGRIKGDEDFESDEEINAALTVEAAIRSTVSIIAEQATIVVKNDDDGPANQDGTDKDETLNGDERVNVLDGKGGKDIINGFASDDELIGGADNDKINGGADNDTMYGGVKGSEIDGGVDEIKGETGNDIAYLSNRDGTTNEEKYAGSFDGGSDMDDLYLNGDASDYRIFQYQDEFKFYHQDYKSENPLGRLIADAKNIEKFEGMDLSTLKVESAFELRATKANGTAPTDMTAIRDYDGNDLGDGGDWKLIGEADVQFDGDAEFIYINQTNGRWATVGTDKDGMVDFSDHGMGGETRVVGIYIDPEVELDPSKKFGPFDSQQRFQNDLNIDNLTVIDAYDFDQDGFQEIYFKVNDGTAYLRALMHADGNIQYANYQSSEQVEKYLTDLGYDQSVLDTILV